MDLEKRVCMKVVGVGGGGTNAVNRMVEVGITGVDFLVMNTDAVALETSLVGHRIQLGTALTRGLGVGGDPNKGMQAAEESRQEIKRALDGADMVFITAGMGGGTGTGAAPVVASIARELGALTVGVVTRPFRNEGPRRARVAEEGLRRLAETVDALITIPNDRLLLTAPRRLTLREAFWMADDVLRQGVQGISEIISVTGDWNVDFADVRSVLSNAGTALMGIGTASGENRAVEAAQAAISSPLLETNAEGARGVLINITAPEDFLTEEFDAVTALIRNVTDPEDANIITGLVTDVTSDGRVKVTVIATGFPPVPPATRSPSPIGQQTAAQASPHPTASSLHPRLSQAPDNRASSSGASGLQVLREEREALRALGEDEADIPTFLRRGRVSEAKDTHS